MHKSTLVENLLSALCLPGVDLAPFLHVFPTLKATCRFPPPAQFLSHETRPVGEGDVCLSLLSWRVVGFKGLKSGVTDQ